MQLHCAACVVASQALITPATPLLTWAPNLMKVGNFRVRFQYVSRAPDLRHAPPRAPPYVV
jgi:K+ transporter